MKTRKILALMLAAVLCMGGVQPQLTLASEAGQQPLDGGTLPVYRYLYEAENYEESGTLFTGDGWDGLTVSVSTTSETTVNANTYPDTITSGGNTYTRKGLMSTENRTPQETLTIPAYSTDKTWQAAWSDGIMVVYVREPARVTSVNGSDNEGDTFLLSAAEGQSFASDAKIKIEDYEASESDLISALQAAGMSDAGAVNAVSQSGINIQTYSGGSWKIAEQSITLGSRVSPDGKNYIVVNIAQVTSGNYLYRYVYLISLQDGYVTNYYVQSTGQIAATVSGGGYWYGQGTFDETKQSYLEIGGVTYNAKGWLGDTFALLYDANDNFAGIYTVETDASGYQTKAATFLSDYSPEKKGGTNGAATLSVSFAETVVSSLTQSSDIVIFAHTSSIKTFGTDIGAVNVSSGSGTISVTCLSPFYVIAVSKITEPKAEDVIALTSGNTGGTGNSSAASQNDAEQDTLGTPVLKSVKNTAKGVKIKWNAVDGATGYRVLRKVVGKEGAKWKVVGKNVKTTKFVDTTAKAGVKYRYTVRAYRGTYKQAKANKYSTVYWSDFEKPGLKIKARKSVKVTKALG